MEYFAIKNWDQADGGTHRRFVIRYVSGFTIRKSQQARDRNGVF